MVRRGARSISDSGRGPSALVWVCYQGASLRYIGGDGGCHTN